MVNKKYSTLFKKDDKLFKALIENSWDVVLLIDAKARVLYASPSIVRQFGRDYDKFIGISGLSFIHPADVPRVAKLLGQILLNPRDPIQVELRIRHKSGHYLWVEAIATNLLSDKNIQGIVVNFHDITEMKMNEERKDEFISIATHELRTPITSLKAYLQILRQGIKKMSRENVEEFTTKMESQVIRLERHVKDLYDSAMVHEGKLPIKKEKFELLPLIKEIAEDTQRNYGMHKLVISAKFSGTIIADKMRIQQVLVNLFSNAIKFSPDANKIRIMIWNKDNSVSVSVTDYGIGIAKENISKITNRFFQTDKRNKQVSGLGLGLYIAHDIIKQHNGNLLVKSTLGKSTTVTFMIPKR